MEESDNFPPNATEKWRVDELKDPKSPTPIKMAFLVFGGIFLIIQDTCKIKTASNCIYEYFLI